MELVIPSKHIPMFHRVIQCLAKIGEDIRFQIPNDKAVRDSRDDESKQDIVHHSDDVHIDCCWW